MSKSKEKSVEYKVKQKLIQLGWQDSCVSFEIKTKEGKQPDICLLKDRTCLCVVEIKNREYTAKQLSDALRGQAMRDAKSLECNIAVVTNGSMVKTLHLNTQKSLSISGINVDSIKQLIPNNIMQWQEGHEICHRIQDPAELKKVFHDADGLLAQDGKKQGFDRFKQIYPIMFLKLLCEKGAEEHGSRAEFDIASWNKMLNLDPAMVRDTVNGLLKRAHDKYDGICPISTGITSDKVLLDLLHLINALSFTKINADVQGEGFEHFVATADNVKTCDFGQYFTPRYIVRMLCDLAEIKESMKIYDPFCGTGGILIESIRRKFADPDKNMQEAAKDVHGCEFGEELVDIAKMNMALFGDGKTHIYGVSSLTKSNPIIDQKMRFDRVISNMPFKPFGHEEGIPDIYYHHSRSPKEMCIEHCLNSLNNEEGSKIVVICPEGLLSNIPNKAFRKYIMNNYCLELVVSLPQNAFKPYTDAKSSILVISVGTTEGKDVDFYDVAEVENDKGVAFDGCNVVSKLFKKKNRYKKGFYKVLASEILKDRNISFVGSGYKGGVEADNLGKYLTHVRPKADIMDGESCKILGTVQDLGIAILKESRGGAEQKKMTPTFKFTGKAGNILASKFDCWKGNMGIIPSELDGGLYSLSFYQLEFKSTVSEAERIWIMNFLLSKTFKKDITKYRTGTTNRRPVDVRHILEMVHFKMPTKQQLAKFTTLGKRRDALKASLEEIDAQYAAEGEEVIKIMSKK